jgi:hypothetical protein
VFAYPPCLTLINVTLVGCWCFPWRRVAESSEVRSGGEWCRRFRFLLVMCGCAGNELN